MFILGRGRLPMYADKLDLPYTEAVVMEIQRTANIGPLALPHCNSRKGQCNFTITIDCYVCTVNENIIGASKMLYNFWYHTKM